MVQETQLKNVFVGVMVFISAVLVSKGHTVLFTKETPLEISNKAPQVIPKLMVHVAGEIHAPGLYEVEEGMRVVDVIDLAGGALKTGNLDRVNLAKFVTDGSRIYIPKKKNSKLSVKKTKTTPQKRININLATQEQLESVPGLGPKFAKEIISLRKNNGRFLTLDPLLDIKGIGPKTLNKLSHYLTCDSPIN